MTREQLDSYRSKKAEVKELKYRLDHLGEGDSLVGNDVIMDYRTGYPRPQSVVGFDYDKFYRLENQYTNRIQKLQAECDEVERWIENIPDSLTRRIFRMYFIDAMTQQKMSKKLHLDQSRISRKISDFFKNA